MATAKVSSPEMHSHISFPTSTIRLPRVSVVRAKSAGAHVSSRVRKDVPQSLGPEVLREAQSGEINEYRASWHERQTSQCTLGCPGVHPPFDCARSFPALIPV